MRFPYNVEVCVEMFIDARRQNATCEMRQLNFEWILRGAEKHESSNAQKYGGVLSLQK